MTAERFTENQFGRKEIPSLKLTIDMVPDADAPYPSEIVDFALTCDGYAHFSNSVSTISNHAQQEFAASGNLPQSLDRLRACLFWQQRFWRNDGELPDTESMNFIRALIEAIRVKVLMLPIDKAGL